MVGAKCPLTKITSATTVPLENIITTTVIPSVEPNKPSKHSYDSERNFLTRAYINSYSHPLNEHEFGLHQLPEVQERNLNFGYLGSTISVATIPQDTAEATSLISIDQDAPSPSTTPNTETTTTPIQDANVEEPNHEHEDVEFDSDTFTNPFAPPVTSSADITILHISLL
ncbi:hypothetical protein Tco_0807445 [Tanacetum coccineum]